jgi:hypothetical protein
MSDRKLIGFLYRIFPAEWRSEYGLELCSILERDALTPMIVWNVLCSGLHQRARRTPAWIKAALLLACWFLLGLGANTIRAMPPDSYNLFWIGYVPLEVCIGYWFRSAGSSYPGRNTTYAVLVGSFPMLGIEFLREAHVIDPTVLDLRGHIYRYGRGFTEFAFRGVPGRFELYGFVDVVIIGVMVALAAGWLGGQIAEGVQAFRIPRGSR